jgi:serine/threonine protein kinase
VSRNTTSSPLAQRLFDDAVELDPRTRGAYLADNCPDPLVRREVESLLAAYDDAGAFFSDGARTRAAATTEVDPLRAGRRIDAYELTELIGEGGFASVFRAFQSRPVRREVALKVIKLGMDTRSVIARFEQERQALAMMDHPNIAAVYDAGATDTGRPYFAMELVRGARVTRFCDDERLTLRQRVELFIDVCHAVHHAHQKGVLHRDIKPSNILVTKVDERPVPKVIDFGIAKATQQRLTDQTIVTQERQVLGTPQYMSPEQFASGGADVDTRGDIYSLGATLYELLAGAPPLEPGAPASGALEQARLLSGERELPRASARFASLGDAGAGAAAARSSTPAELRRELRGELDWILAKCLETDRARRYESAAALAADLRAYLEQRPITAAPPAATYRARKFVRRNAAAVTAAAAVALTLVVAAVVSVRQAVRATRAERLAQQRLVDAQSANANMRAVNDFLARDMIGAADPAVTRGREMSIRQALDNAAAAVAEKFKDNPLTGAAVRDSVAMAYLTLGHADLALAHAERALRDRREKLGDQHPDTIVSMEHYAAALQALARYPEAESAFKQALDASRRVHGDDHVQTIRTLDHYGDLLSSQERLPEAEAMCREAWERARRVLGDEHPTTLASAHNYAHVLFRQGRTDLAAPLLRQVLDGSRRVHGPDHPDTITTLNVLARALSELGRRGDAEPLVKEVLESRRRVLGDDHPATLTAMHNYAGQLQALGRAAEAEALTRDVLERRRRLQGDDHPETLMAINALADLMRALNRPAEADPLHAEALERRRRVLGPDHSDTLTSMSNHAAVLGMLGRFDEAEALHQEAIGGGRRALGEEHPFTLTALNNYASILQSQRRFAEAEPIQQEILALLRRVRGPEHPHAIFAANNYASTLRSLGRFEEAAALSAEVYERAAKAQIAPAVAAVLMAPHGPCLVRLGRYDEAEAPLREAHRRLVETKQSNSPRMREVLAALAEVCERTGRADEAAQWRDELESLQARPTTPATRPTTAPSTKPAA